MNATVLMSFLTDLIFYIYAKLRIYNTLNSKAPLGVPLLNKLSSPMNGVAFCLVGIPPYPENEVSVTCDFFLTIEIV